jgi:hypothetical protein
MDNHIEKYTKSELEQISKKGVHNNFGIENERSLFLSTMMYQEFYLWIETELEQKGELEEEVLIEKAVRLADIHARTQSEDRFLHYIAGKATQDMVRHAESKKEVLEMLEAQFRDAR